MTDEDLDGEGVLVTDNDDGTATVTITDPSILRDLGELAVLFDQKPSDIVIRALDWYIAVHEQKTSPEG